MNKREIVRAVKNVNDGKLSYWVGVQKSIDDSPAFLCYATMSGTPNYCRESIDWFVKDMPKGYMDANPFIGMVQIMVVVDAESTEVF